MDCREGEIFTCRLEGKMLVHGYASSSLAQKSYQWRQTATRLDDEAEQWFGVSLAFTDLR